LVRVSFLMARRMTRFIPGTSYGFRQYRQPRQSRIECAIPSCRLRLGDRGRKTAANRQTTDSELLTANLR
jgi:hypothetical protein